MTLVAAPSAAVAPWTCPFCPLLCDDLAVAAPGPAGSLGLSGGECPLAQAALSGFTATPSTAQPSVDGRTCDLETAVAAAAHILAGSRQPLFGGLGTDVAGARALYRLACETGAICGAARGSELMQGQRLSLIHI